MILYIGDIVEKQYRLFIFAKKLHSYIYDTIISVKKIIEKRR